GARNGTLSVTFSETMSSSSITTNTEGTSCSGTIQLSSDSFSTCHQMNGTPSTTDGKTFTLSYSNLTASTIYKIRVTTGVKDLSGNSMSSQDETSNGFTTAASLLMGGSIQGSALNVDNVTTFAGTAGSSGRTDATGTAARFNKPLGITSDDTNLYVADNANHIIRKIVISSGEVTTIAGQNSTGSNDGTGTAAKFHYPHDLTTDGTNIYVSDYSNDTIRKIVISTGEVTTFAGVAGSPGFINGTGTEARFEEPWGITTDGTNLYVAERKNNSIRKIVISTQVVSTLAGGSGGFADGTGTSAKFWKLKSITTDGINIFAADSGNNRIRKIVISSGVVTTLAGSGTGSADGTGTGASLYAPAGIVTDGTNLYVASQGNHNIRKIVISSGVVTTIAGSAGNDGTTDGSGSDARFEAPMGITTDGTYLYVSDRSNHTVRKIE
ncbi:MAG: Ig-like domain-containing protein, partial [Chloroflexota bacterium]|nr:Ig-like domain-containing protein [Chloroflexota bacterium]